MAASNATSATAAITMPAIAPPDNVGAGEGAAAYVWKLTVLGSTDMAWAMLESVAPKEPTSGVVYEIVCRIWSA